MGKVDLSVIGKKTEPIEFEYTWRDVVLYALGVGATADELPLVYENAPGGLKVLDIETGERKNLEVNEVSWSRQLSAWSFSSDRRWFYFERTETQGDVWMLDHE